MIKGEGMKIELKNCRNIQKGIININVNKLNIFYGPNGTGKTTISKSIQSLNNEDLKLILKPYHNLELEPLVTSNLSISSIRVFDETYISKYLFKKTDVLDEERVYEVMIKDKDLESKEIELQKSIKQLKGIISDGVIRNFYQNIGNIQSDLTLNVKQKGISKSSKAYKAMKQGNIYIKDNIPSLLEQYKGLLVGSNNIKWLEWFVRGHDFDTDCPYCRSKLADDFDSIRTEINNKYSKTHVQTASKFMNNLKTGLTDIEPTVKDNIVRKFDAVGDLDSKDLFLIDKLSKLYEGSKYLRMIEDLNMYTVLDETKFDEIVDNKDKLVDLIDLVENVDLKKQLTKLISTIETSGKNKSVYLAAKGRLLSTIKNKVRGSEKIINDFMETAGIPYKVEVIGESTGNPRLTLKHISSTQVSDISEGLSFGERNAFALIMFMMDVSSEQPELIILDDPISSFDENKKYALMHAMFLNNNSYNLKNKTVLMLTHDFTPIIDLIYVNNYEFITAYFLKSTSGVLTQNIIEKKHIKSIIEVSKMGFSEEVSNKVLKVVNYRRYLELTNQIDDLRYDVVSSLFKLRATPIKFDNERNATDLTSEEIKRTEKNVNSHIVDFTYAKYLAEFSDKDNIIRSYDEATEYGKIKIIRILQNIVGETVRDRVLLKFINESYHIENTTTYQLDPKQFYAIPEYIINACNEYVNRHR